ncbi:hypothetical protein TNCV_206371 [Trichonephila clavipes]|nr:hypothetical protein TNCV_206371 [Trichonephila clavipes]
MIVLSVLSNCPAVYIHTIILRENNADVGVDRVQKDSCVFLLIHRALHNDKLTQKMPGYIPQTIMLPPIVRNFPKMFAGFLISEVSRRLRSSIRWSIKLDSSENSSCRYSVDVKLYWCANSGLR